MEGTVIIKNFAPGNDVQVELQGASATNGGAFLGSATVEWKLFDIGSTTAVTTQSIAVASAAAGNYLTALSSSLFSSLTVGQTYVHQVTASSGGEDGRWRIPIRYQYRQGEMEAQST